MSITSELLNANISTLDDEELKVFIKALTEEKDRREREKAEQDWNELVKHIKNYLKRHKQISIESEFFIDDECDFSIVNEIWMK